MTFKPNFKPRPDIRVLLVSGVVGLSMLLIIFTVSCQQPANWSADGIISLEEYANEVTCCVDLVAYHSSDEQYIYMGVKGKTTLFS